MNTILGIATDNQPLRIGDTERRSGLYILGKPRMGKSWLIINMILQDLQNNHGVFFLDPQGDTLDQIIPHLNWGLRRPLVYDFEDQDKILCLNPFGGPRADPAHRNYAFAKTKAIFDKLWKNTFEEKPWLQLIIQNTIYTFIENQDYTLAEFPMFFRDREFREFLISKMQYNMQVKDYWLKTFASKARRDQDNIMEAAQTRCEIMFAHPSVRCLLGYGAYMCLETRMNGNRSTFIKLSTRLPYEVRKIIGTVIINEMKFAIDRRPTASPLYCLYIDEFQNFVSFEDMSVLITQAPKLGISTTLAHHDRFGQLEDNKGIIGATSAIANKVLFQVTIKDAHEFAPEFREDPPTEMRDEDVYAVSQSPFYDLLQGHNSSDICALVDRYIRPMKERLEDIYGDRETERLIRTEYLDEANLSRVDERIGAIGSSRDALVQRGALGRAGREISKAKSQVERLKELNEEGILIRATIRTLNRLFIDSMEGKVKPGQEAFSNRLVEISKAAVMSGEDRRILELYIGLIYGGPFEQRILPFECAKRQGLFKEHVEKVEREIKTEFETQRAIFARRVWQMYEKNIERIIKDNIRMYNKDRKLRREPECDQYVIEHERELLKHQCGYAIEAYEGGRQLQRGEVMYGYHEIYYLLEAIAKDFKPLVRRQPNDIAIPVWMGSRIASSLADIGKSDTRRSTSGFYAASVRNDLTTRGFDNVVESIDGLVKLCDLLAKPINHLQIKTRQRGQKAVQTRTIADMTNEMVQDLTELSKYTAHAKILQGKEVWKGKITTCSLPQEPYDSRSRTLKDVVCGTSRTNIEETIRQRQENWRPEPEREEDVPKPVEEPKKPKKPKNDTDPESEPPPPRRPKKPGR